MRNFKKYIGKKYGKYTISEFIENYGGQTYTRCICDCGNKKIIKFTDVKNGRNKSCGCDNFILNSHDKIDHPIFYVWIYMLSRCYNNELKTYENYGGRGITVCDDWKNSFDKFVDDMFLGYEKGLQLDRINVNGNYCKENCRWITVKENCRNKRNNIMIRYKEYNFCISEWVERLGISRHYIEKYPIEKCLTMFNIHNF